jgi:hypothetical protein
MSRSSLFDLDSISGVDLLARAYVCYPHEMAERLRLAEATHEAAAASMRGREAAGCATGAKLAARRALVALQESSKGAEHAAATMRDSDLSAFVQAFQAACEVMDVPRPLRGQIIERA